MTGDGQSRKQRGGRRQLRIDDLLTACRAEVVKLERGAARDLAASEQLVRLMRSGATWDSSEPGTSGEDIDEEVCSEDDKEDLDSEGAIAVPDPVHLHLQDGGLEGQRHSAEIAQQLLEALAHDNTVMECNVRDYEVALSHTLDEIVRTRAEVVQMESVFGQMGQLQELLAREGDVHVRLHEEHAQLVERQHELLAVIQEAIEAEDDEEDVALARGLQAENAALRRLLFSTGYTEPEIEYTPPPPQEDPCEAIAALRERELVHAALQADPPTRQFGPSSSAGSSEPLPRQGATLADQPPELSREEPPSHLSGGSLDFHAALQEGLRKESLRQAEDVCEDREESMRRAGDPFDRTGHQESGAQDRILEEELPAMPAAQLHDTSATGGSHDLPAVVFRDSQVQARTKRTDDVDVREEKLFSEPRSDDVHEENGSLPVDPPSALVPDRELGSALCVPPSDAASWA